MGSLTMRRLICAATMLYLLLNQGAQAGTACTAAPTTENTFLSGMVLAEKTRAALDASGAEVALLARVGQDLSRYGVRYSHIAYVWRDHPQGRWLVVHELNECGTARSALFNQGLANFFMDDLFAYESLIVIPGAASQRRLVAMLASPTPVAMHTPRYNMLSYAWSDKYQNSNQWVLESYAAGMSEPPAATRRDAQRWLKTASFTPRTVRVSSIKRLGARVVRANVAFDDHPFDRRMAGQIDTITVEAIVDFVKRHDSETKVITVD